MRLYMQCLKWRMTERRAVLFRNAHFAAQQIRIVGGDFECLKRVQSMADADALGVLQEEIFQLVSRRETRSCT